MQEIHGEDGGGGESILEPSQNIFEKYEVGRLMGCGAFAKVYHARDLRTGQSVAIKAISKQRIEKGNLNPEHVKREISIMHRLRHPNIVRLHEVLATKNKIYYVMEFAKGGELFGKMAKGRFSEDLSRRYFQQLISAVRYCHSRGIYHRDLKPENLLLDENWDLKVTDFGLSAVKEQQTRPDGLLHTLCGTPAYVAPEILAKKGYDGAKVDIWSCGVILFVLNAGYLPFNDTNLMAMYRKIYRGEFRCPKWTSPELKRFFSRILDTNPVTRITIDEIMDDPWVKRGGFNQPKVSQLEWECELLCKDDTKYGFLNAFDIISLSPGLDLSGIFRVGDGGGGVNVHVEKFVSSMSPEMILGRFEEVAKEEKVETIKINNNGLRLEGCGGGYNGNFMWLVDVLRLTAELVVVEIKRRDSCGSLDLWKNEFRPRLNDLVYDQLN